MSSTNTMSLASTYVLASRVRSKLTKQATNPKSSLRTLVLQANMLDNIMDHISLKTKEFKLEKSLSFSTPDSFQQKVSAMDVRNGPMVTEYEIDSDSDSDSDPNFDQYLEITDYGSDEDDDEYYYSSDSDVEDRAAKELDTSFLSREMAMPVINLADDTQLSVIFEENAYTLPELTHSIFSSDSDSEFEDEIQGPHYFLSAMHPNTTAESLSGEIIASEKPVFYEEGIKDSMVHHLSHGNNAVISSMDNIF